jgi:hypothetical protein
VYWAGPESYERIAALGGRLVVSNFANDTPVRLYWAHRQGLKLVLFNSAWVDDSVAGGRANTGQICKNVNRVKDQPGLWGYYVIDEPSKHRYPWGGANPTSVETMREVNRAIKRCDPHHPTVAVFLPGGGFGGPGNDFAPGIADAVMFDVYPLAPDGWHPEWITDYPLPQALAVVRARDPRAKVWLAVQAFGACAGSGCFPNVGAVQLQTQVDLGLRAFRRAGVPLSGLFFFLWDRHFDDDQSWITDDMRSHRDFWRYVGYAAERLPPSRLGQRAIPGPVRVWQREPRPPVETHWAIVTRKGEGGATLAVMGPTFYPRTAAVTAGLRSAATYRQLADRLIAIAPGRITRYSTMLLTGSFTGPRRFKVSKAVLYYAAPPAP